MLRTKAEWADRPPSRGRNDKPAEGFRAAVLAVGLFATPALALAQLNENPIKTGFWSFPSDKTGAAKDILAACRDHFEVRFADGHFIGVRLRKTAMNLIQRQVEDVGICVFSRETQIEKCSVRITHYDGSVLAGTLKRKYLLDVLT
jgi:hypothetical protein